MKTLNLFLIITLTYLVPTCKSPKKLSQSEAVKILYETYSFPAPVYKEIDLYSLFTAWDFKRLGFEKQGYVKLNTNPFYHGQRIAFTNKACQFLVENKFLKETHHQVIHLGMMRFREVKEIRYSQNHNQAKILFHVLVYDLTPFHVLKSNLEEREARFNWTNSGWKFSSKDFQEEFIGW